MNFGQFFKELKRRDVYRVAVTYAIVAWLILQVASVVIPILHAPEWIMQALLFVIVVGFPVALVLAWVFEMTTKGIKKTPALDEIDPSQYVDHSKPLISYVVIGVLMVIVFGQMAFSFYRSNNNEPIQSNEKSIAVLPFKNESSNLENQYFCNGIMEGVLDHLAKISDLTVISRSSVEPYRGQIMSPKNMAQQLKVEYLVEGSVQRMDDRAIIRAQLVKASNAERLWSEQYERDLKDVFAIQAEIAKAIAKDLEAIISPEVKMRIEAVPTEDPLAYDYYLQGHEYLLGLDNESQTNDEWNDFIHKAELSFELSLNRDSSFANALLGLAMVEYKKNEYYTSIEDDYLKSAVSFADQALAINPGLSDGYLLRSRLHIRNSMTDHAKIDLAKALELNPNSIEALYHDIYINTHIDLDFVQAIKTLKEVEKRSVTTDELWRLYHEYYLLFVQINDLERCDYYASLKRTLKPEIPVGIINLFINDDRKEEYWQEFNEKFTQENQFKLVISANYHLINREPEIALIYFRKWEEKVLKESPEIQNTFDYWHRYGQALIMTGDEDKGRTLLQRQIEINTKKLEPSQIRNDLMIIYDLASIYAFLEDRENCYYWLNELVANDGMLRYGLLVSFAQSDYSFDKIRGDDLFKEIISKALSRQKAVQDKLKDLVGKSQENILG